MKITYKLFIVVAISLITIVGLSAVSYTSVKTIDTRFDTLVQYPIPSILRLSNMTEAFLLSVEEAHSYALYGRQEDRDAYFANAREFDRLMEELKQDLHYGTADILPADTQLIDSLTQKVASIKQKIESDIALHGQPGVVTVGASDPFADEKDQIVALLHQYRNMERDEIETARVEVDSAANQSISIVLITSLILLLIILTVNGLLAYSITKPLRALGDAVKRLGEGDMNNRVGVTSKDELGELAQAFNHMADSVQQSYFSLEAKVQERTIELERARVGLEQVVAERTAELERARLGAGKQGEGA